MYRVLKHYNFWRDGIWDGRRENGLFNTLIEVN